MVDLTTKYMGLTLPNPVIIGSSGITNSVESVVNLEQNGAGAVVLKSIFEEEILNDYAKSTEKTDQYRSNLEFLDYYDYKLKEDSLNKYIDLIKGCKKNVSIPVIASINCLSTGEWINYAKTIQEAGADALELNIFVMPSDFSTSGIVKENIYFDIIEKIKNEIDIPVALKTGYFFSNLGNTIQELSKTGISGIVLFNRFYNPDFDINTRSIISSNVLSTPEELSVSLRWIAIMAQRVKCDLVASTGIHSGEAIVKQILAGADAVQVVSAIYKNGASYIQKMIDDLEKWMYSQKYFSLDHFRGKMSQAASKNPAYFERVQFMKYFSDRD